MQDYKELMIWKDSMLVVKEVYELTSQFPDSEKFGLVTQMRRAAISIPSNIAEGAGSISQKEFRRYLVLSISSSNELDTQLSIAAMLHFVDESISLNVQSKLSVIRKQTFRLIQSIESTLNNKPHLT
jgi:four helix bundle protein